MDWFALKLGSDAKPFDYIAETKPIILFMLPNTEFASLLPETSSFRLRW